MPLASPTLSGPCSPRNGRPSRHFPQQPGGLNLNLRLFTRARTLWVAVHFNMGLDGARSAHSFAPGPAGGPAGGPAAAASGRTSPLRRAGPQGTRSAPENLGSAAGGFTQAPGGRAGSKRERVEFPAGLWAPVHGPLHSCDTLRRAQKRLHYVQSGSKSHCRCSKFTAKLEN